jgi:glycosyltransferase involved in cell wall biosynthesis
LAAGFRFETPIVVEDTLVPPSQSRVRRKPSFVVTGGHAATKPVRSAPRTVDLVVVVNGFPRLSETFVLHELLELERRGARLHVVALRRPEEAVAHSAIDELRASVEYLPETAVAMPKLRRRLIHAALALRRPGAYAASLAEIVSSPDFSRSDLWRALALAQRIMRVGSPPLYLHFAHRPATIGRFAALLTGVPYGLSAHAKDVWTTPREELRRKIQDARVVLTCTSGGRDYLSELVSGVTPIRLVYHGVDTGRRVARPSLDGIPVVLCVGRLVEKKGHATLLQACALLRDQGVGFRLRLAGEGPEWARLQRLVHQLDLDERVSFLGPLTESETTAEYDRADIFALACRELDNGDRDGIPNVILEAMAHSLPVVSTDGGSVGEAVVDGEAGLVVPQGDVEALASALRRLVDSRNLRHELGQGGRRQIERFFDRHANLPHVVDALSAAGLLTAGETPGGEAAPSAVLSEAA